MGKAVKVRCVKDSGGKIWAQFDHDSEKRTYVTGYEANASYKKKFKYDGINELADIIAFIESSTSCKQFTKVECKNMCFIMKNCAYLEGRNGRRLSYFGGGPAGGAGCACGITGTCDKAGNKCNCDSNNNSVLKDEGFVTKKADLPLSGIALGDTGSSWTEYGYHTIGKLQCME